MQQEGKLMKRIKLFRHGVNRWFNNGKPSCKDDLEGNNMLSFSSNHQAFNATPSQAPLSSQMSHSYTPPIPYCCGVAVTFLFQKEFVVVGAVRRPACIC